MLSIRIPSWQGPQPTAQDQAVARSERRLLLQRKTYTRYGNNVAPRNTGVVRACVNVAMVNISAAEMQSALRESVYVTPAIAHQLRYMSSFTVPAYVPHDAIFAASDMAALPLMDRFALLRDYLLTVLRLGLNDDVPKDAEPLDRVSHLVASFNEISNTFRRFLIAHYSVVRGRMRVVAGVINRDIGVWESDLSTLVRDKNSGATPPGASTVIEMFPLPARKGMTGLLTGGGCCSPCNPCRLPPLPPHLHHSAAASTPTSVPLPTVPASYFCSTVTAGWSAADTATIRPISPHRWLEALATTAAARHQAASPSQRSEAQVATATAWVASATARMAPSTARH